MYRMRMPMRCLRRLHSTYQPLFHAPCQVEPSPIRNILPQNNTSHNYFFCNRFVVPSVSNIPVTLKARTADTCYYIAYNTICHSYLVAATIWSPQQSGHIRHTRVIEGEQEKKSKKRDPADTMMTLGHLPAKYVPQPSAMNLPTLIPRGNEDDAAYFQSVVVFVLPIGGEPSIVQWRISIKTVMARWSNRC